ncbi:MAG TPA: hypothetical protein VFS54_12800 [Solirubrobacterales bacterium]|nr:hypothetical protein [Solirubrobacterales bacterium]
MVDPPSPIRPRLRFPVFLAACGLAILGFALAGCGDSGASSEELEAARKEGAVKAHQAERIREIQKELKALRKNGGSGKAASAAAAGAPAPEGGSSSSGSGNCGGSLSANSVTTCGFAENVEEAYYAEIGSGSGTVYAYSPTTGQGYSMYCTAGSPHECTGGNDAAVYFP